MSGFESEWLDSKYDGPVVCVTAEQYRDGFMEVDGLMEETPIRPRRRCYIPVRPLPDGSWIVRAPQHRKEMD